MCLEGGPRRTVLVRSIVELLQSADGKMLIVSFSLTRNAHVGLRLEGEKIVHAGVGYMGNMYVLRTCTLHDKHAVTSFWRARTRSKSIKPQRIDM